MKLRAGYTTRRIETKLIEGENSLLVKLIDTPNNNTTWAGLSLRILDPQGHEISPSSNPQPLSNCSNRGQ
jgi:hypothetical protein